MVQLLFRQNHQQNRNVKHKQKRHANDRAAVTAVPAKRQKTMDATSGTISAIDGETEISSTDSTERHGSESNLVRSDKSPATAQSVSKGIADHIDANAENEDAVDTLLIDPAILDEERRRDTGAMEYNTTSPDDTLKRKH